MKNFDERNIKFGCTLKVNCGGMACESCEIIAKFWYRFAFESIRNEIKRLNATRRRINIKEVSEFIDEELGTGDKSCDS